ncbi:hypothetical protein BAUCODRAFT_148195 [Baudoinia panamericana UAMH 10762]|uniref:Uncharacterized protein n=1 Tax=Baudoinia panamericana (strain UAMH 10762) TaxID=717646 RepID=M2MYF3_BAUPA|nr:uncharacterized protein BAUCODRAFT_148195 [Baudoinia panamericana UAMH 10762]EMC96613.1 hypothetical protein BAUCODRAFT_148195 [Baudoinia panamericana UAMH 10762]
MPEWELHPDLPRLPFGMTAQQSGYLPHVRQPLDARPSSERNRLRRKRSVSSMRWPQADAAIPDIEKEIQELNNIVEERRRKSFNNTGSPHVAAIAPHMPLRARSETLSDIGSALARTVPARSAPTKEILETCPGVERARTRPTLRTPSGTSSRISGWLSGLVVMPTAHTPSKEPEPFYKCRPPVRQRAYSEASLSSDTSDAEPPSLTVASSPTTKGHSRSLTAESRLTPLFPPIDTDALDTKTASEQAWPTVIHPSQVGLAL